MGQDVQCRPGDRFVILGGTDMATVPVYVVVTIAPARKRPVQVRVAHSVEAPLEFGILVRLGLAGVDADKHHLIARVTTHRLGKEQGPTLDLTCGAVGSDLFLDDVTAGVFFRLEVPASATVGLPFIGTPEVIEHLR
jgi:hypothetical protein